MTSKYWLKLFHETIYDPKIMMRSPGARLRWYECLCLAGDVDRDGELPSIEHMVFVFRVSEEQLLDELSELVSAGMIVQNGDAYIVKNWTKRQSQMPDAERKYRDRDSAQKKEYYGEKVSESVTNSVRNSDADIDIDKEVDVDKELDADVSGGGLPSTFTELYPALKPRNEVDQATWTAAYLRMNANGVTPAIMRRASRELADKRMKVASPASLERPCLMVMQKDPPRKPDSAGAFKEFINH
jgi:hypothetical protein